MIKRAFDIVISFLVISVSLPLWLIVAIAIKLNSPGPVFYRGSRIGKDGKPFAVYKFRTMVVDAPKMGPGITGRGDSRITRVGSLLRKLKIDEMPQLINVLKGDMSLVGPRPDLPDQFPLYSERHKKRPWGEPDMTDWAQHRDCNSSLGALYEDAEA